MQQNDHSVLDHEPPRTLNYRSQVVRAPRPVRVAAGMTGEQAATQYEDLILNGEMAAVGASAMQFEDEADEEEFAAYLSKLEERGLV
jgi:hypothetical protein